MNAKMLLTVAGIALLCPAFAVGEEPAKRPEWDQKKAVEMIKQARAVEEAGQPFAWDKIAWMTDADKAVARAQKENKPIFVFFFLANPGPSNGPAAAPC